MSWDVDDPRWLIHSTLSRSQAPGLTWSSIKIWHFSIPRLLWNLFLAHSLHSSRHARWGTINSAFCTTNNCRAVGIRNNSLLVRPCLLPCLPTPMITHSPTHENGPKEQRNNLRGHTYRKGNTGRYDSLIIWVLFPRLRSLQPHRQATSSSFLSLTLGGNARTRYPCVLAGCEGHLNLSWDLTSGRTNAREVRVSQSASE